MKTNVYEIFLAVVEQQGFIKASEQLFLTPSAISQAIAKLESEYDIILFERTRNGAILTDDGQRLLPFIRNILNAEEHLNQQISMTKGLNLGSISIGTFNSVCVNWIPDIINSFKKIYSDIAINIYQGGYADTYEWLKTGETDISFITMFEKPDYIDATAIFQDRIMCVTNKNFEPKHKHYVSAEDLAGQTLIHQSDDYIAETSIFVEKYGISTPSKHSVIESDQSIIAMVESGLGISLMPELVLKKIVHSAKIYPLVPETYRTIGVAHMKNRPLSYAAQKMLNHILNFDFSGIGEL